MLHVFKTAAPESRGGIPAIMELIANGLKDDFDFSFLIASNLPARTFEEHLGFRTFTARHAGQFMSMPVAPTLPLRLRDIGPRFDMIALHAPFPLADIALYLNFPRHIPLVVHWHAPIVRQTAFRRLYEPPMRKSLTRAKAVIVTGDPIIDVSAQLQGARDKCVTIPFGVDARYWGQLSAQDRKEIESIRSAHPRLILAVGRLVSYKGLHILAEAMRELDAQLWIVGTGPLRDFIGQRVAAAGADSRVRFLGEVSDTQLRRLYHAACVLAFPSISDAETFGMVQLEAMACGLPIVNTGLNTMVPHVARHEREALTVPPHDPRALATALGRILYDGRLRRGLAHAARARAASEFTLDRFLRSTGELYRRVLTRQASGGNREARTFDSPVISEKQREPARR